MTSINRSPYPFTITGITSPISSAGTYTSGDLVVGTLTELAFDVNVTTLTGTSPTLTWSINRKGTDGIYYPIYTGSAIAAAGKQSTSLGAGLTATPVSFGSIVQIVVVAGGTVTSAVFTMSLTGK